MIRQRLLIRAVTVAALLLAVLPALARPGPVLAAVEPATGAPTEPSPTIISPDCPVSPDQLSEAGGLAVCVDRGEGATCVEGDRITVCAAANIPTIAIYPPPPLPTVRVESIAGDGSSRVLLQDHFSDGQRCLTGTVTPPLGHETVRAQAIREGTPFLEDTVSFTSQPR